VSVLVISYLPFELWHLAFPYPISFDLSPPASTIFPTATQQHRNTAEPQFAQSSFSEFPGV